MNEAGVDEGVEVPLLGNYARRRFISSCSDDSQLLVNYNEWSF